MYYGQRRGPEARGFYNPYQKTPDWGAGIRDMLNNFRIMKQYRDEMEQREESSQLARDRYEQGVERDKATEEYRTKQIELTKRAATEKGRLGGQKLAMEIAKGAEDRRRYEAEQEKEPSDIIRQAKTLVANGQAENLGAAVMMIKKVQTPEQELDYLKKSETMKEKIKAQFEPKEEEKGVTPGSQLTNRRIIWEKAHQTAIKMQNTEGFDTSDEKTIRKHKELAGFYVDMPDKFNALLGIAQTGQANPEELEYIRKGKKTWDYMHSPAMKKIKKMEDLTPSELETLDREIIKFILWNRTGKVR